MDQQPLVKYVALSCAKGWETTQGVPPSWYFKKDTAQEGATLNQKINIVYCQPEHHIASRHWCLSRKGNPAHLLNLPCCGWLYQWKSQNTLTKNLTYRVWLTSHPSKLSWLLMLWPVQCNRPDALPVLGWDWQCLLLVSQSPKLPYTGRTVWLWAVFLVCCQCTRNMVEVTVSAQAPAESHRVSQVSDPWQLSAEHLLHSSPSWKAQEWNLFEKGIHSFSWIRLSKYGL